MNPPAKSVLAITFVVGFVASIAFALCLRAGARAWLDVPKDLPTLKTGALLISVLFPVAGNSFGFFMAYRKPRDRALLIFLGPGAVMVTVGITISLLQLPSSASIRSVLVTVVMSLIPTALIVSLLLHLRSRESAANRTLVERPS